MDHSAKAIRARRIFSGDFIHRTSCECGKRRWISQRKNTLAMVFFLLSILAYLRHAERNSARWYWLSLLAFLLAMLSKGSVAVLPVVLLLMVWWQRGRINKLEVMRTVPFFIVAIILTGVNIWFQKHGLDLVVRDVTFFQRLAGAGGAVWFYLSKAFAPFHLVFVYPQWQIDPRQLLWWLPVLAAAIVTVVLWRRQRSSQGSARKPGGFFRLVTLLRGADSRARFYRRGLHAVFAGGRPLRTLSADCGGCAGRRGLGLVVLSIAGRRAFRRHCRCRRLGGHAHVSYLATTPLYSSPLTLYQATLRQNPNSWLLHNNVGVSLHKVGQLIPSIAHLQVALTLNPNFADAHYNYANVLLHLGQTSNAIEEYEKALRLKANYASAHDNLGSALAQSGREQEAVEQFQESLRIKPQSAITHNNLGNALNDLGRSKEAIEQYKIALRLKPDYAEAHNNLGVALFDSDLPVAILEFQLALQKKPNYADAENNLGNALLSNEQPQLAIEHYQEALRLKPAYVEAYANLAKALAQTNQRAKAISAAEKAVELARAKNRKSLADQIEAWLTEYRSNANPADKPGSASGTTHPFSIIDRSHVDVAADDFSRPIEFAARVSVVAGCGVGPLVNAQQSDCGMDADCRSCAYCLSACSRWRIYFGRRRLSDQQSLHRCARRMVSILAFRSAHGLLSGFQHFAVD